MARPEGYRKAVRLMELADRFGLPVLTFVDTAGAYPGIEAEERGQAEAIARLTEMQLGARRAERLGRDRRGRLGRRDRDRHRQQGADAGARDLQRDLAGRRGLDPLARRLAGRGHRHEDHRPGSPAARRHRGIVTEPVGRRPSRPEVAIRPAMAIAEALQRLGNMGPAALRDHRRRSSWRSPNPYPLFPTSTLAGWWNS